MTDHTLIHQMEATADQASYLPMSANSPKERAAALRHVIKATRTRAEEDELLWMLGLHYRPEPPRAKRHPMYSDRVIPAEQPEEVACDGA